MAKQKKDGGASTDSGQVTLLTRATVLKHGGASFALYIVITSFHQLFPPELQGPYIIRWVACVSCLIISYLFMIQERHRDLIAYVLMW